VVVVVEVMLHLLEILEDLLVDDLVTVAVVQVLLQQCPLTEFHQPLKEIRAVVEHQEVDLMHSLVVEVALDLLAVVEFQVHLLVMAVMVVMD
jgi:hypothetical protein